LSYESYRLKLGRLNILRAQLKQMREEVSSIHQEINLSIIKYCSENDIPLNLEKNNCKSESKSSLPDKSNASLVQKNSISENNLNVSKLYKKVAKVIHPDRHCDDPSKREKMESLFKEASRCNSENDIFGLLSVAEESNVQIDDLEMMTKIVSEQIKKEEGMIRELKKTVGWLYFECEDSEECKLNIVKKYVRIVIQKK